MSSADAEDVMNTLISVALRALAHSNSKPPETLYHFTSVEAATSIVSSQSLRLSLAVAQNDRTEMIHGLALAEKFLGLWHLPSQFVDAVEPHLAQVQTLETPMGELVLEPFVTSFCEREESSAHWLHYGRSGQGIALAMNSEGLEMAGAIELARVEYDEAAQIGILRHIATSIWQAYKGLTPTVTGPLLSFTAALTGMTLRAASIRMKAKSFSDEREWRLITLGSDIEVDSVPWGGKNLAMDFRSIGSRIVPYLTARYEKLPLTAVVLGASADTGVDDVALMLLLSRRDLSSVRRMRSAVPVRP